MSDRIVENLHRRFPSSAVELDNKINRPHSEIYIFNLYNNRNCEKILVKYYKNGKLGELVKKYDHQKEFYKKTSNSNQISCPKLIDVDVENDISIMEYVDGSTLKSMLKEVRYRNRDRLAEIIQNVARALGTFHTVFGCSEHPKYDHSVTYYNDYVLKNHINITNSELNMVDDLSLSNMSNSFIDFSPPNIIVNGSDIYLIDFPNRKRVSTPHLDLARFKFYLKLIDYYPRFKFPLLQYWGVDELFDIFLESYCDKVGEEYNSTDTYIINKLQSEFAIEVKEYYSNPSSAREYVIKYYMQPFISNIIERD